MRMNRAPEDGGRSGGGDGKLGQKVRNFERDSGSADEGQRSHQPEEDLSSGAHKELGMAFMYRTYKFGTKDNDIYRDKLNEYKEQINNLEKVGGNEEEWKELENNIRQTARDYFPHAPGVGDVDSNVSEPGSYVAADKQTSINEDLRGISLPNDTNPEVRNLEADKQTSINEDLRGIFPTDDGYGGDSFPRQLEP
jgi:hypothetical protein